MSRARRSAVAALVVLTVLGLLWPRERSTFEANSFGTLPAGQRALFELLTELDLPVARSFEGPEALAADAVVWWIEPRGLCDAGADGQGAAATSWDPRPWLRAGGTAVVFLPTRPYWSGAGPVPRFVEDTRCERLGPFALPPRDEVAVRPPEQEDDPATPADTEEEDVPLGDWLRGQLGRDDGELHVQRLEGELVRRPRVLDGPRLRRFRSAGDFAVRAYLRSAAPRTAGFAAASGSEGPSPGPGGAGVEATGPEEVAEPARAPFVLERAEGDGRLVVVADGSFLSNAGLGRGDAAPLALDLVRAFGPPALDEREHGLRREQRPLVYLAGSPALGVFAGLALLGLLALWHGTALPRRAVREVDPSAPELERFVESLAGLYARSRDHARVADRYRALSLARVRRHFGLAPEVPDAEVLARLRRERRLPPDALAALDPGTPLAVSSAAELRAAARRFDRFVKEACR